MSKIYNVPVSCTGVITVVADSELEAVEKAIDCGFDSVQWDHVYSADSGAHEGTKDQLITIPYDEWLEKYEIEVDSDGRPLCWTGQDFKFKSKVLWTLIDSDDGGYPVIMSGRHYVNRLEYYMGLVPHDEDLTIQVGD